MAELDYNELLVLNTILGYNIKFPKDKERTVNELIGDIEHLTNNCDFKDWGVTMTPEESITFLNAAKSCVERNKDFGNYVIVDSVERIGNKRAPIVTFANGDDAVVVFWGTTGPDEWYDNVIAGDSSIEGSEYQNVALDYIKNTSLKYDNITVTGHSKGGNKAQYVALMSDAVDRCVAFDGQGFSKAFIDEHAELINSRKDAITLISSNHDIVNALLFEIAGNILYVDSSKVPHNSFVVPMTDKKGNIQYDEFGNMKIESDFNFFYYHKPDILLDENGNLYDYEGVEPANIVKFVNQYSEYMSSIEDTEIRNEVFAFVALMAKIGLNKYHKDPDENKRILTEKIFAELKSLNNTEAIAGFLAYTFEFAESNNLSYNDISAIVSEMSSNADVQKILDSWYMPILYDALFDASRSISQNEFVDLCNSVKNWAENNNMTSWDEFASYIKEDPFRIISLYASMDVEKETVHKAISKFLAPDNVAAIVGGFAEKHPVITGASIAAISTPGVREIVATLSGIVLSVGVVCLTANHIVKNWDKICDAVENKANYIKEEISEFYSSLKGKIKTDINNWVGNVFEKAEKFITKGSRIVNSAVDGTAMFLRNLKDQTISAIKDALFISNPVLYMIVSRVYKETKQPVKINVSKISDCVDRMNKLAKRVSKIDQRLDDLYWRLAQNNIEQDEGLFTSLANIYNLFRADLNVDEGASIKRKARALTELYDGYKSADKWVLEHIPKKI